MASLTASILQAFLSSAISSSRVFRSCSLRYLAADRDCWSASAFASRSVSDCRNRWRYFVTFIERCVLECYLKPTVHGSFTKTVGTSVYRKNLGIRVKTFVFTIAFFRTHPHLVFLLYKGRHIWITTCDCKLAAPTNFIRGISAGKMDSFRLDFVSVNDKRGPVINDHL